MKRLFGSSRSTDQSVASVGGPRPSETVPAQSRSPTRARHSVAVSTLGSHATKNPFHHTDGDRPQAHLPPSRSHAQISSNLNYPSNQISKRSISASYVSKAPSQRQNYARPSHIYGRGRSFAPLAGTPEKPKSRIEQFKADLTRRLDVWRILDWPADKWMEMLESFELMDYDEYGYQFGIGANAFHFFVRLISAAGRLRRTRSKPVPNVNNRSSTQLVGDRLNEVKQHNKSRFSLGWVEFATLLSFLMCIYSCYNAYKLFTTRKSYQMHLREDPVNSPNATLVQSPTAPQEEPPSWGQTCLNVLKGVSSLLIGWPNPGINQIPKPTQVHQLDMWDIDEFKLRVFTVYPPPQAILVHFASLSENCFNWTLLMMATIFQTYWIVKFYSQLMKDKAIIQSEVMHEYNSKFVYPKAFPHTREAATMTSAAEFIRREDWLCY